MNPMITSNDTSINIKYIDDEESHYQLNIPNNDINKDLIENTIFKFEKSGAQTIIMHDDNNVFQLSKMECNYSEFIEIKKQLENTQKELILLKQELSNFKNDLQIKKVNDKSIEDKNEIENNNESTYNTLKKNDKVCLIFLNLKSHIAEKLKILINAKVNKIAIYILKETKEKNPNLHLDELYKKAYQLFDYNIEKYKKLYIETGAILHL